MCTGLVHVVPQRPHPVHPLSQVVIAYDRCSVQSATRIGPWTDPVRADLLRLVESNHLRRYVHICMLMTRRSRLSVIRQAPHSCNSRCLRASTTWRSGCNPIDCSSTRPSGARGVDDRIKFLRTHSQLAMTPSYQHHQCMTWVLTST